MTPDEWLLARLPAHWREIVADGETAGYHWPALDDARHRLRAAGRIGRFRCRCSRWAWRRLPETETPGGLVTVYRLVFDGPGPRRSVYVGRTRHLRRRIREHRKADTMVGLLLALPTVAASLEHVSVPAGYAREFEAAAIRDIRAIPVNARHEDSGAGVGDPSLLWRHRHDWRPADGQWWQDYQDAKRRDAEAWRRMRAQ